jgi:hypothetical protein
VARKDEEEDQFNDDEEYVPKRSKISAKSVVRGIGTGVVIVLGLILLNEGVGNTGLFALGFILLCAGSTLINLPRRKRKKIKQVFSIFKCAAPNCGVKELHEFKEGDYVFKKIGPCFNCDEGFLYIDQIFAVLSNPSDRIRITTPDRRFQSIEEQE